MITIQMKLPTEGDIIELPDLLWQNEFLWSENVQSMDYGVSGSLFVAESKKLTGREIILSNRNDMSWITRETVLLLKEIKDTIGHLIELKIPNDNPIITTRDFNVIFDQSQDGLNVSSLKGFDDFYNDSYFIINSLKFFVV